MLSVEPKARASHPARLELCAILFGMEPALGARSSMVVPAPDVPELLLKLQTIKSPALIGPEAAGAMARP